MSIDLTLGAFSNRRDVDWEKLPNQLVYTLSCFDSAGALAFSVFGDPKPWKAAKATGLGGHKRRIMPTPGRERMKVWQETVQTYFKQQHAGHKPFTRPVVGMLVFFLPKSRSKARGEHPIENRCGDLANLKKATEDALNGILWQDDRQIIGYELLFKFYEISGLIKPGCIARYWEI